MKTKTVKSKVDDLLNGLVGRLEKLEKVTVEQFPEVCKEIVNERKVDLQNKSIVNAIGSFLSLLVLMVSIFLINMGMTDRHHEGLGFFGTILAFFSAIGIIAFIVDLTTTLLELRVLKIAPKVYVLKQLRKLVK